MIEIKEVVKKDIPIFLSNPDFWNHSFLAVSKHRLYAHYKNPNSEDNDVVLLLAYLNNELVGYMGVFIDIIKLDDVKHKIGWLSTWWVHPKTKGSGIGRAILEKMYDVNKGKIGISQFTASAKRVYDKSGYFETLKENEGIKAVLRSNLSFIGLILFPRMKLFNKVFNVIDPLLNIFINLKLNLQKQFIKKRVKNITIEYLNTIDSEAERLIAKNSNNHISPKGRDFFEWLKAFNWIQDAPLLEYTEKDKYAFSTYDRSFCIYMMKIFENGNLIGFVVLQKRNRTMKVLFTYYEHRGRTSNIISDLIKLQSIGQNIREIICYDSGVSENFRRSFVFIYKRKKVKQSIISKVFGKTEFNDVHMNFGDGDCSFA